jgi:glycogen debranching enzyme
LVVIISFNLATVELDTNYYLCYVAIYLLVFYLTMQLPKDKTDLRKTIYDTILELSTEKGINASGKDDIFGCIFGRDSAITILKILKVCASSNVSDIETARLLEICKSGLLSLISLQGKEANIESGEEPGKFIHEYRPNNYERLLKLEKPWYIYPDGVLKNYDSLDSTPLSLIAIYRYWEITRDDNFLLSALPSVESGLNWIISYGDRDKDYLLEYELAPNRLHGGLPVQSWTDSQESMIDAAGNFPEYPIAPVEVQGYAWLALHLWADFYADTTLHFAKTQHFSNALRSHANGLKKQFNKLFIYKEGKHHYAAQALDGCKKQIKTVTGSPLLLLWAAYKKGRSVETVIGKRYIKDIVRRAFTEDMFDKDAGIRTMSTNSKTYVSGPSSYHNGSFWPKLNGMSHEGLENFGFYKQAAMLKYATLKPIQYFGSPIELYVITDNGEYDIYRNSQGQESCRQQAWSAAAALDLLTHEEMKHNYFGGMLNLKLFIKTIAKSLHMVEFKNYLYLKI